MKARKPLLFLMAFAALPTLYAAECNNNPPPPPPGERRPPHHFDPALCNGKTPGAAIEVKAPDGKILKGTCQLVFLPAPPPGDQPGGAPGNAPKP
jgi:hypothetical protein